MKIKFVLGFLLVSSLLSAQNDIPLGTWRTHFSYNAAQLIALGNNKTYVASDNGLFIFDNEDNSLTTISKIDGLQEDNISALHYNLNKDILLIGYESGNLDLIRENELINYDLITNSQVLGDKSINNIGSDENNAFISTAYGLLNFDLNKLEVRETYRQLGEGAQEIEIFQSTILGDSLFLASEEGVIASNFKNGINLLDPANWKRHSAVNGLPSGSAALVFTLNNKVLSAFNNEGIYEYENGKWTLTVSEIGSNFQKAVSNGEQATVLTEIGFFKIESSSATSIISNDLVSKINDGIVSGNTIYIADNKNGLITNISGQFESIKPSGPSSNNIFKFHYRSNMITGVSGGYSSSRLALNRDNGFYQFTNGAWSNTSSDSNTTPEFKDIVDVTYDQKTSAYYYALFGGGILKVADDGVITLIDNTNSTLSNIGGKGIPVSAVKATAEGLWAINYAEPFGLHLFNDGQWSSFLTLTSSLLSIENTNDYLWMIVDPLVGGGILVFDKETQEMRYLTDQAGNGGLPNEVVNTLAVDKDGYIWVGTNEGIAVFTNPINVISGTVDAILPIFENRQLLRDEIVTSIEIDPGNRKWIGTNSGVWLFDEEADRQLLNFNIQNSPLPSNQILDIEVNEKSGEVFFATPEGIISYRADATEALPEHTAVRIFPNPVTSDFLGTIGISGLVDDAKVKITDSSGKLVWDTRSEGGTATWNVQDYNGRRATTGVYFVFSATDDGEESFVGKIAVID
ncbi:two-component regulator propeller domain-containing protein [Fulvivirga sp.]|uniref:type IX secretion system anionic LPS delivery protein PorZ n=1 Tax=Fulvivirga sp. TaxID=1931237 RepID=UPI0032EBCD43